ncbi:MAG: methyltransferase domain-containing protein [Thermoanaerobaculia bacterium]
MFEYQTLFDARGALYNRANRLYPEARAQEAAAMLRHLGLSPRSRWLDVFSGGGYLSERAASQGLPPARFSCDGSLQFLHFSEHGRSSCVASAGALPFPDGRFDAVACLAALHHAEDPRAVCRELLRVATPGGHAALGDVAEGSRASRFLNGFVDGQTEAGHRGRFYGLETLAGFFEAAGGETIHSERAELVWVLPSAADAVLFCRDLFGLVPSTCDGEIEAALAELGAPPAQAPFRIPWTMHYVSAARP